MRESYLSPAEQVVKRKPRKFAVAALMVGLMLLLRPLIDQHLHSAAEQTLGAGLLGGTCYAVAWFIVSRWP